MVMSTLIHKTARAVVAMLRRGEISPLELIDAAVARIEAVDGTLNALPTRCVERARAHAERIMRGEQEGANAPGWLGGLPIAIKDLNEVAGVSTTYGSPLFAHHVPDFSDVTVQTLERRGGIVLAKANAPEFGHGGTTFNEVFGHTCNPWNTSLTCGGSSGGSAVAVASGQTWLATGSDLGTSLRTPAAFCSIVGLRPSPGRVARAPARLPFDNLWVQGPMARNVGDAALMLDAMAGPHRDDPISLAAPKEPFVAAVEQPQAPKRIAYSPDLGGIVPVAREVAEVCAAAAGRFHDLGVTVEEACPDLSDAKEIFRVLRANQFVGDLGPVIEKHRTAVRKEVVWNYEQGMQLTADALGRADRARGELYARAVEFFETYDLLLCPTTSVPPFDLHLKHIDEVEGHRFESYFEWYTIGYALTLTSLPVLSLPCGFTAAGLPVGMQVVGPPRGEHFLLGAASLFESALGIADRVPVDPQPGDGGAHQAVKPSSH